MPSLETQVSSSRVCVFFKCSCVFFESISVFFGSICVLFGRICVLFESICVLFESITTTIMKHRHVASQRRSIAASRLVLPHTGDEEWCYQIWTEARSYQWPHSHTPSRATPARPLPTFTDRSNPVVASERRSRPHASRCHALGMKRGAPKFGPKLGPTNGRTAAPPRRGPHARS